MALGGDRSLELNGAKKNSQGSQNDWFQPISSCTCHVGVQRCISEHLKSKHLQTVHLISHGIS